MIIASSFCFMSFYSLSSKLNMQEVLKTECFDMYRTQIDLHLVFMIQFGF